MCGDAKKNYSEYRTIPNNTGKDTAVKTGKDTAVKMGKDTAVKAKRNHVKRMK